MADVRCDPRARDSLPGQGGPAVSGSGYHNYGNIKFNQFNLFARHQFSRRKRVSSSSRILNRQHVGSRDPHPQFAQSTVEEMSDDAKGNMTREDGGGGGI